jgi:nicotinate-nucleotide adenylyltransferase
MKNIALFGGSFDPPHIGHIEIINKLKEFSYIDKIVIMPTYLNPFKTTFKADAKTRLDWLKKIFKDEEKVEVCDFEVNRSKKTPTLTTVKYLKTKYNYKNIYIVIGADNLLSLNKWYGYEELKKEAKFIIATRNNIKIPNRYLKLKVDKNISSTKLRQNPIKNFLPDILKDEIYNFYKN